MNSFYEVILIHDNRIFAKQEFYCIEIWREGEIEDGYYYIVKFNFTEYADELRAKGQFFLDSHGTFRGRFP